MRTAVFDLDGTLVDTSFDMLAAANVTFEALGVGAPLKHPEDAVVANAGGRAMWRLGVERLELEADEAVAEGWYSDFIRAYSNDLHVRSAPFPDVEAALDDLAASGWALAICTNKPELLAERLLVSLGMRHWFGALVGAGTLPVRKPDPTPLFEAIKRVGGVSSGAVLIGDTITDRDTARRANIPCALVGFGPIGADVAQFEPDAILDAYGDLRTLLEQLVSTD